MRALACRRLARAVVELRTTLRAGAWRLRAQPHAAAAPRAHVTATQRVAP
jgi:hypothetical protein